MPGDEPEGDELHKETGGILQRILSPAQGTMKIGDLSREACGPAGIHKNDMMT